MAKLTPEEKEHKRELSQIIATKNRCIGAFSFSGARTFRKMLLEAGASEGDMEYLYDAKQLDAPITASFISKFFDGLLIAKQKYKEQPPASIIGDFTWEGIGNISPVEIIRQTEKAVEVVQPAKETLTLDELTPRPHDRPFPQIPGVSAILFPFQVRAFWEIVDGIVEKKETGLLLRAGVGTGKTFIIGAVIAYLKHIKWEPLEIAISLDKIILVTRASIVEQTKRVLEDKFGLSTIYDVNVFNIEQLRCIGGDKAGAILVDKKIIVRQGVEYEEWSWKKHIHPVLVLWDECQGLKNEDSTQSKIAQALNDVEDMFPVYQVFFSATPFMRVCEAKCVAVATHLPYRTTFGTHPLTNHDWHSFAKTVASPADPTDYNEASCERLMKHLSPYVIDVKGVRPQFNARNSTQLIDFATEEEKKYYDTAWERFLKKKAKLENSEVLSQAQSKFLVLVELLVLRTAAEYCKRYHYAKAVVEAVAEGKVVCLALNFKKSIIAVVKILIEDYGWSRDDISIVWGGGQTGPNKKQKQLAKLKEFGLDNLAGIGINLEDFELEDVDDWESEELPESYRLKTQSLSERQKEIDRFQSGKSKVCLYTFKAGGVGLSLHHTDEMTKEKCRRQKNGWYVVEDIPKIPTRQRITIVGPTYSAIELVQGLGRAPRLTSMSETPQVILFYRGTIEERVCQIVSAKLRCLRKVVRTKESWEDVIVGGVPPEDHMKNNLLTSGDDDEESSLIDVSETTEEESE